MRDYWLTQYVLTVMGWGYAVVCVIAIALALWLPKGKMSKGLATAIVIGLASILPFRGYEEYRKGQEAAQDYNARLATAELLFDERCKTAGEKIYKTVENVEGVLLLKLRPEQINFSNQYVMDDPYGQQNWRGEGYVKQFLAGRADDFWLTEKTAAGAYRFVDVIDEDSKKILSYAVNFHNTGMQLTSVSKVTSTAIYSIDWKDESTQSDRDNWIACGSVSVINISTGEVLGKRTGCMLDRGMGSTIGGRSPWSFARDSACPAPRKTPDGRAIFDPVDRNFVEKVLKPIEGK